MVLIIDMKYPDNVFSLLKVFLLKVLDILAGLIFSESAKSQKKAIFASQNHNNCIFRQILTSLNKTLWKH